MANLTPTPRFDNVYQLETSDPVLGGAPVVGAPSQQGISNWSAQGLVNRTAYLKQFTDMIIHAVTESGQTLIPADETQLADAILAIAASALSVGQLAPLSRPIPAPKYATATSMTVTIPKVLARYNRVDKLITVAAATYTLNLNGTGLNAVDVGGVAVGQTLRLYMAKSQTSATCGFFLSQTANLTVIQFGATTYDVISLPYHFKVVDIGGSPGLLKFVATECSERMGTIHIMEDVRLNTTSRAHIASTTSTQFVDADLSSLLPSTVRFASINLINNTGSNASAREKVANPREFLIGLSGDVCLRLDSSQLFEFKTGAGASYAHLIHYLVEI